MSIATKVTALVEVAVNKNTADVSTFAKPIYKALGSKDGPFTSKLPKLYRFAKSLGGLKFVKPLKLGSKSLGLQFELVKEKDKSFVQSKWKSLFGGMGNAWVEFRVNSFKDGVIVLSFATKYIEASAPTVFGKKLSQKVLDEYNALLKQREENTKAYKSGLKKASSTAVNSGWPTNERMAGDFVADLFSRATSNAKILLIVKKASKYMADAITKVGAKPGKATWDIWPEDGDYVLNIQVPVVKGQKAVEEHLKSFSTIGVDKKGGYKLFMEDAVQGSKSIDLDTL